MTKKSSQGKPILGFTDTETIKLDLDFIGFKNVKYWAHRTFLWFKLGGYIIFKSSQTSYHVIFNTSVSWGKNMKVVAWVALHSQNRGLIKWLIMQCIKQSSTLRVSQKKKKHAPRIVYRYGKQDERIQDFLVYRNRIKRFVRLIKE